MPRVQLKIKQNDKPNNMVPSTIASFPNGPLTKNMLHEVKWRVTGKKHPNNSKMRMKIHGKKGKIETKIYSIDKVKDLDNELISVIKKDIKNITTKRKNINYLKFNKPQIMGILNITPDSFSDGGKYNQNNLAKKQLNYLFESGADLVDIGGESTRPGSKSVESKVEWNRIKNILKRFSKKKLYLLILENLTSWKKG